jgi:putative DNA primase/helicase
MAGEDVVRLWLDERCDEGRGHRDSFGALWGSWKDWAERAGEFITTKKRFGQTLQERGFHPEHDRAGRFYSGLSVRPQ